MKYLLKQNKEDKGILCEKVTIDGFDYYVSDETPKYKDYYTCYVTKNLMWQTIAQRLDPSEIHNIYKNYKKVIATNNPNIDIPKVVDEVEEILNTIYPKIPSGVYGHTLTANKRGVFIDGYNKSQETHPNSDEDMMEFAKYYKVITCNCKGEPPHPDKNSKPDDSLEVHFQLWKKQKPKIVYYEKQG